MVAAAASAANRRRECRPKIVGQKGNMYGSRQKIVNISKQNITASNALFYDLDAFFLNNFSNKTATKTFSNKIFMLFDGKYV